MRSEFVRLTSHALKGNDDYTKLLLHFDGSNGGTTFTDSSSAAHGNATIFGSGVTTSDAQTKFGATSYLSGGSGHCFFDAHSDWVHGAAEPFTLDMWVRPANNTGASKGICAVNVAVNNYGSLLVYQSNGQFVVYATTTSGSWNVLNGVSIGASEIGVWAHLAITYDGSNIRLFKDGVQVGPAVAFSGTLYNPTEKFTIGSHGSSSTNRFAGHIDELRWSKGTVRWVTNFSSPIAPYW